MDKRSNIFSNLKRYLLAVGATAQRKIARTGTKMKFIIVTIYA